MPTPTPAGPGAVRCQQLEMILTNDGRFGPYFGEAVEVPRRDNSMAKTPKLCLDIASALLAEKREVLQIKKADLIQYATDYVNKLHPEAIKPIPVAAKKAPAPKAAAPAPAPAAATPPEPEVPAETPPPAETPAAATTPPPAPAPKKARNLKTPPVQPQAAAEVPSATVAAATTPPPAPAPAKVEAAPAPVAAAPAAAPEPKKLVDKVDVNLAIFALLGSATILAERDTTPGANDRRIKLASIREDYLKIINGG